MRRSPGEYEYVDESTLGVGGPPAFSGPRLDLDAVRGKPENTPFLASRVEGLPQYGGSSRRATCPNTTARNTALRPRPTTGKTGGGRRGSPASTALLAASARRPIQATERGHSQSRSSHS